MPAVKDVFLPDSVVIKPTISVDKLAVTCLVQGVIVSLNPVPKPTRGDLVVGTNLNDPPLVATRMGTLYVQLEPESADATVEVFIRGHADLPDGTQAAVVARIAGQTFTGDPTASLGKDKLYTLSHTAQVPAGNGLLVTVLLLADRTIVDGGLPGALLTVDSLDLEFKPAPAGKGYGG